MADDPVPSRRQRERNRHRQEILDAALRVVNTRGVDGVTIEYVAREAEFAVGSIYRYFRSKDELLLDLLADLSNRFLGELESIVAGPGDFDDKLEHVVQLAHDRQVEIFPLLEAFTAAPGPLPAPGSSGAALIGALRRRHAAAFDALVAAGQAAGRLRPGKRAPMVLALTGIILSFAKNEAQREAPYEGDATADLIQLFLWGAGVPDAATQGPTGALQSGA